MNGCGCSQYHMSEVRVQSVSHEWGEGAVSIT